MWSLRHNVWPWQTISVFTVNEPDAPPTQSWVWECQNAFLQRDSEHKAEVEGRDGGTVEEIGRPLQSSCLMPVVVTPFISLEASHVHTNHMDILVKGTFCFRRSAMALDYDFLLSSLKILMTLVWGPLLEECADVSEHRWGPVLPMFQCSPCPEARTSAIAYLCVYSHCHGSVKMR